MTIATDDPITRKVIEWLQLCFNYIEEGREEMIPRIFGYKSPRGELTMDYANRVIEKLEAKFISELEKYPDYHYKNAYGATEPPGFTRLSPTGRMALVEGLDQIITEPASPPNC